MLKIIDYYPNTKIPFPLKKLEKFGFEDISAFWFVKYISVDTDKVSIGINKGTRLIQIAYCSYTYNLDVLFELIQAGLVEKVEVQDD